MVRNSSNSIPERLLEKKRIVKNKKKKQLCNFFAVYSVLVTIYLRINFIGSACAFCHISRAICLYYGNLRVK